MYHHGWLYLLDDAGRAQELFNHARTSDYLTNSPEPGCLQVSNILVDAGCPSYRYVQEDVITSMTAPEQDSFDITDLDVAVRIVGRPAWNAGAGDTLVRVTTYSWAVLFNASGELGLFFAAAGNNYNVSAAMTEPDGTDLWVRITRDTSTGDVTFYWAPDEEDRPTSWTTLGSTTVGAGEAFHGGVWDFRAESTNDDTTTSQVRRVVWLAGIGGSRILDLVTPDPPEATVQDAYGNIFTVNGDCLWQAQDPWTLPQYDPAPWYNSRYPESAKALGFWIEEWTGLDSGHVQRGVQPIGTKRGGGQLSRITNNHREMAFNIFMFGASERALDYMFRWLDATLSSVCATCATNTVLLRRFCPDLDLPAEDASDGVVEMRGVGLLQGLQWEDEPVERLGCFMRRASFTLAAEDPCMYSFATNEEVDSSADLSSCFGDVNVDSDRDPCRPTCSELTSDCRTVFTFDVDSVSASGARVKLANSGSGPTIPTRVRLYADPGEIGVGNGPCGLPLVAELYVKPLPEDSELIWDGPGRQVLYQGQDTAGAIGGFQYVDTNTVGVPRFAGMGCQRYHVILEPGDLCLTDEGGGAFSDGVNTFDPPRFPTPTLDIQERMGCA